MASLKKRAVEFRSGHIKSPDASGANAITIIRARSGTYRILNTGDNEFTVRPDGQDPIILRKKASADVEIANSNIVIEGAATEAIRGIYECIDIDSTALLSPVRAGRYKGPANVTGGVTLVQNRSDDLYRILNSAKSNGTNFDVRVGANLVTTLEPRLSIDLCANAKTTIIRANAQHAVCIYDHLDGRSEVQSGRFSVSILASARHKIIDLTGATRVALYRIHNTGDQPFVVRQGAATVLNPSLKPEQSFDFEIRGAEKEISVSPIGGAAAKLIEGIYEFFGQA